MFAELFYPKELKEVIADLRAKGDLNEVALKTMQKNFLYACYPLPIINILMLAPLFFVENLSYTVPVLYFVVSLFYIPFLYYRIWITYYEPFVNGMLNFGYVKNVHVWFNGDRRVYLIDTDLGAKAQLRITWPCPIKVPKAHQKLEFYTSTRGHSVLASEDYMKMYCLQKSLLTGEHDA